MRASGRQGMAPGTGHSRLLVALSIVVLLATALSCAPMPTRPSGEPSQRRETPDCASTSVAACASGSSVGLWAILPGPVGGIFAGESVATLTSGERVRVHGQIRALDPTASQIRVRLRVEPSEQAGLPFEFIITGPGAFSFEVPPGHYWFGARSLDRGYSCGSWFNGIEVHRGAEDEVMDDALRLYGAASSRERCEAKMARQLPGPRSPSAIRFERGLPTSVSATRTGSSKSPRSVAAR